MIFVILSLHLLVCLCLIGLVLLQRSEGGALGMGGGSGALVSGRGAADALARMTSVAGGFFLVTSLGLTFLSGAAGANAPRGSVLDARPGAAVAPLTLPEAPADAGAANDAILDVAAVDATATPTPPPEAAPRAAPLPTAAPSTAPPRPTRSADATPNRGAAPTAPRTNPRPLVLPDSSGAALTLDPSQLEESVQTGDRLEAVRRERAGPDQ
jgi:preprotein translocase subunit SecG